MHVRQLLTVCRRMAFILQVSLDGAGLSCIWQALRLSEDFREGPCTSTGIPSSLPIRWTTPPCLRQTMACVV